LYDQHQLRQAQQQQPHIVPQLMCRLRARIGVRVASSALVPVFITVVLAADEKGVAAEVLDERVSGADDSRAAELFEATHRSQSGLQPSVIGFDRIVFRIAR
jgi:hypothetical protein